MQNPLDALQHMSEQMGWLGQFLGEDFWAHVRAAADAGVAAAAPGGDRPAAGTFPPVDMYVTPGEVVVSMALPGLAGPQAVCVTMAGPLEVVVEGFVPPECPMDLTLQRERFCGYFARSLVMPVPVASGEARASYRDGILELRLARSTAGGPGENVQVLSVPGNPYQTNFVPK